MSKISSDLLATSIDKVLAFSKGEEVDGEKGKVRGFTETIELQVTLRNYDPNKDKRFSGALRLPAAPRGDKLSVCVLGNEEHIGQAKALGLDALVRDFSMTRVAAFDTVALPEYSASSRKLRKRGDMSRIAGSLLEASKAWRVAVPKLPNAEFVAAEQTGVLFGWLPVRLLQTTGARGSYAACRRTSTSCFPMRRARPQRCIEELARCRACPETRSLCAEQVAEPTRAVIALC